MMCEYCQGRGELTRADWYGEDCSIVLDSCPRCNGTGIFKQQRSKPISKKTVDKAIKVALSLLDKKEKKEKRNARKKPSGDSS